MTDTYRGETAGKRLARAAFWERVAADCPQFATAKKVCLAGRTLGDLATLESLGATTASVTLAERNADAFAIARASRPDAGLVCGDVRACIDKATAAVFLDYCSYLWEETAVVTIDVWKTLPVGAFLGAAFMRGREQPREFRLPPRPKAERTVVFPRDRNDPIALRRRWTKGRSAVAGRDAVSSRGVLSLAEDLKKLEAERMEDCARISDPTVRAQAERACRRAGLAYGVFSILWKVLRRYSETGEHVHPVGLWVYRSGVPMVICLYRKGSWLDGYRPKFANRSYLRQDGCDPDRLLRESACALGAQRFNLPAATVAAWRAHATRGTYEAAE
jgi:hypothetical protein